MGYTTNEQTAAAADDDDESNSHQLTITSAAMPGISQSGLEKTRFFKEFLLGF